MITISEARLFLKAEGEGFVRELYGRWDAFCRRGVEEPADEILSRYDSEEEVIRVERMELDLGKMTEEEFYDVFPRRMAEKLEEGFGGLVRHREAYPVEIISLRRDSLEVLLYFLLSGRLPGNVPEEYRDLKRLLWEAAGENGYSLGRELRRYGEHVNMRRRLVRQFGDRELEKVVEVTEPSEAVFIKVYTRSVIASWPRLRRPEITSGDYRDAVWEVVWAYLLGEGRGFFSRKQLVRHTIAGLASRFNLKFYGLLCLLTAGLRRMVRGWLIMPELAVILSEIRVEEEERLPEDSREWKKEEEEFMTDRTAFLRRILSSPESCRRFLIPLPEEEIYRLVEVVVPAESRFVIAYARGLEEEKERGMLEGRAGEEFRVLKWEFMFLVLLSAPSASFQRKRFVFEVLCRLSAHYNLDVQTLLLYLCADMEGMPVMLKEVLQELYTEQVEEVPLRLAEAVAYRVLSAVETLRLRQALLQPFVARRLLHALPETGVYRLVRLLIPAESGFVIAYARTLEREKEKGMLEGQAGEEFRVLKWEFMFLVLLSPVSVSFQRKQFVRSVLRQIAAHYNLSVAVLLDYFFRVLKDGKRFFMPELAGILQELRMEEAKDNGSVRERSRSPEEFGKDVDDAGKAEKQKKEAGRSAGGEIRPEKGKSGRWEAGDTEESTMMKGEMGEAEREIRRFLRQQEYGPEAFETVFRLLNSYEAVSEKVFEWLGRGFARDLLRACRRLEVSGFIGRCKRVLWQFWLLSTERVRDMFREMLTDEEVTVFLMRQYGRKVLLELLQRIGVRELQTVGWREEVWLEAVRRKDVELLAVFLDSPPALFGVLKERLTADERKVLEQLLAGRPQLQRKWLLRAGSPVLRRLAEEAERLWKHLPAGMFSNGWLQELLPFVYGEAALLSYAEMVAFFMERMSRVWTKEQKAEVYRVVLKYGSFFAEWVRVTEKSRSMEEAVKEVKLNQRKEMEKERKSAGSRQAAEQATDLKQAWKEVLPRREEERFYVANAGVVILSPYLPLLFERMKWTEKGRFRNEETQVRAIFGMQYLVFGPGEFPETELLLNKLLVDYRSEESLPLRMDFCEEEKEVLDSLLPGAMRNWPVMEHTSADGFRGSFLIRNGVMADTGDLWQLTVEEKSYDVLLDAIPWNISPVKYPWMPKPLYVNWR